ncbi:uncharacterized protein [Haliotis cracherodii]|uniref:uncharacterized protein n=1 Tax=Haliotis cracherodii TaxID=6455 RepID=UPI0039EB0FCF
MSRSQSSSGQRTKSQKSASRPECGEKPTDPESNTSGMHSRARDSTNMAADRPAEERPLTQEYLLSQMMAQSMHTQQLIVGMSTSISQFGDTFTRLMQNNVEKRPAQDVLDASRLSKTRRSGDDPCVDAGEVSDHSEHEADLEDLFDDAQSTQNTVLTARSLQHSHTSAPDVSQVVCDDVGSGDTAEDGDILDSLLEDYSCEGQVGPPINSKLAAAMNKMMFQKMGDEKFKSKTQAYDRPTNCDMLQASKVNPEIWGRLRAHTRSNDIKMQKLQTCLITATMPILQLTDTLLKVKNKELSHDKLNVNALAKLATDAVSLISHANTEHNHRRREMLKPCLNKQFQQLCSPQTPMSTLLFGDNLAETIKDMSATNCVSGQLTTGQLTTGHVFSGPRPNRPSTSRPSFTYPPHRPSQGRGRGFF